jgi:YHS domain-containing protein
MRALLLLIGLLVIVVALSRLPAALRSRRPPPAVPRRDELVKDPVCQTYVPLSRAIRVEEEGTATFFCSRECAARFARGERRA